MADKSEMFKPVAAGKTGSAAGARQAWAPMVPVPDDAPEPPDRHYKHGKPDMAWIYRDEQGRLLGRILRFDGQDGDKSFYPQTFCRHSQTGDHEWRWKSWDVPRPLYGLDRLALSQEPHRPIVISEGEKSADATHDFIGTEYVCLTSPGGSKAADKSDWRAVARRDVIIWPDNDEPGQAYAQTVARAATANGAKSVSIIQVPAGKSEGWDAANAEQDGWSTQQALELVRSAKPLDPNWQADKSNQTKKPQRDRVLEIFDGVELWHDESGEVFATMAVNSHRENWPLRSSQLRRWIRLRYNEATGGTIGGQALEDAIGLMEAKGSENGDCHEPRRRVGTCDGAIYVDLCDPGWRVVRITGKGWSVIGRSPVKFLRSPAMRPLPEPEPGDTIELLRSFLNVASDDDFRLAVSWLVAALRPTGPYPLVIISGEQGSGKSNASKVLRSLVDPNAAPIRTPPKDERDLLVGAVHSHVQALDNLSSVPAWLADGLCRLATGGGFATKTLYTDLSETVISAIRPSILNGIPNLSERADLADRAISLALSAIKEDDRKQEVEYWREFEAARPCILGALFDAVSAGLRNEGKIEFEKLPRMADFAVWIEQCASGLGWEPGEFLTSYSANRADISAGAFEADPMAGIIKKLMIDRPGGWEGTATQLLDLANEAAPETQRKSKFWPGSPSAMGSRLKRVAPLLRREGIETITTHSGVRTIRLVWIDAPNGETGSDQH